MTANLLPLTKEKGELQAKRPQMPAATLPAMKKVASTIFCCTLLVLFAVPVRADQCSGALFTNAITNVAISGNVVTLTLASNTPPGSLYVFGGQVTPTGLGNASFLNGVSLTITGFGANTITANFNYDGTYGPTPEDSGSITQLGNATGCGVLITVTAIDGSGRATTFNVTSPGNGNPYDTAEDTLVGIQNNSGGLLTSIILSSPTSPIFGFDGDGPCLNVNFFGFSPYDCFPNTTTGYEGPNNTFTPGNTKASGTVNFFTPCDGECTTPGIENGVGTWFALEGTQSLGGQQAQTLTFTCPIRYPCQNVQQQVTIDCGEINEGGGCSSPNAYSAKFTYDQVNAAFSLQINVTEVDGNGVCPIPVSLDANGNVPTHFDCTLANFFGSKLPSYTSYPYLMPAGTGSVNTPYCLHYAHNNTKCADIEAVVVGPDMGQSSGFLHIYLAWNADTTTLFNQAPAGYANNPQLYDAPHNDQDVVDYPPAPKGYPYPAGDTDLQKVFNVTGYYNPNGIAGLDSGIGTGPPSGVKKPNHYVVAFPFTPPDVGELLFSGFRPTNGTTCYQKGWPMLVSFEIEQNEHPDPNVQTPLHPLRVTVLQDGVYQNIGNPTVNHLFGSSYYVLLSNANLPVNSATNPYQLQVTTDLIPGPLTQNFVVLQNSCFF